ncbi:MAG TPA: hypothetical protein VFR42_00325 [Candidatus Acidoferrum sp.]|nr:hypothetical protein [Candidatus Acidoferrum sp.]
MQTIPAIAALQTLGNRCADTRFTLFIACPHPAITIRHQPGHYRYYPSLIYTTSIEELLQKFFAPPSNHFFLQGILIVHVLPSRGLEFAAKTLSRAAAWDFHF